MLKRSSEENASLVIVGGGPLRAELENEVSSLGLAECVQFKGILSREAVIEEFEDATALLFTSFEGGGAVVGESLSMSVPVIINRSAGASAIFDEDYPLFIEETKNKNDYTKVCSEVLIRCANLTSQDYWELSRNMNRIFHTKIDWNSKGDELNNVYTKL